jgi:putative ABC transport system permease protein
VLTAQISPRVAPAGKAPDSHVAFAQIVERVDQMPGVLHTAAVPLSGSRFTTDLEVPGRTENDDRTVSIRRVTPDYHRALRIPLRNGRFLEATDRAGAPNVVLINESAARKYFPSEDPIGRRVIGNDEHRTVVGVVRDVHQSSLETEPITEAYVPMAQSAGPFGDVIIRTSGDPYAVLPAVKSAVFAVLPDVPLRNVRTMEELIALEPFTQGSMPGCHANASQDAPAQCFWTCSPASG